MKANAISYCRSQAKKSPLRDTSNILQEQFCELNETLTDLLHAAAQRRVSRSVTAAALRKRIETILGGWSLHKSVKLIHPHRLAQSASLEVTGLEWTTSDAMRVDGLLVKPKAARKLPAVIYVPDCSESPEEVCSRGGPAVRLASRGFAVLVLRLISRNHSAGRFLNNRRHLHRLGWQLGRTFLGAEVSKVRSAVTVLEQLPFVDEARIGIFGYDQGGQIAFLAAALEPRILAAVISNYFGGGVHPEWQPVDRLLFGKAHLFGESELVGLISPERLCVESSPGGRWPENAEERTEIEREEVGFTRQIDFETARRLAAKHRVEFVASANPCSEKAVRFLTRLLGKGEASMAPTSLRLAPRPDKELARFAELESHFYRLLSGTKARRIRRWKSQREKLSAYFDAIGSFPQRPRLFRTRWKPVFDTHSFVGYELSLKVYERLHTYGILLVPKNLRTGECRAAVVCQHGFQGQPFYAVGFHTHQQAEAYNMFGAKLAERGYVVFCPYLCVPNSELRTRLVKKAWLLGGMPIGLETQKFSRCVDFLESLPFVDRNRIGFYGLSYGGYTAMWFTPAEPRFKVVICSGHFNDWQRKTTNLGFNPSCYLYHPDEDMYNFGLLEQMDHVDLATLRAPRPFAVEAGIRDGVFKIEWVRSEFHRVKEIYRKRGAAENSQLFEFEGPHEVHGKATFPFLDRHLNHRPLL